MRQRYSILLSTTSSLEGWEIQSYLGPVSAHMVIGTGALTDFLSAFSDLFGTRSASYRNKIQEIETNALRLLETHARQVGANAVIGLRVDHDEIAGNGKSMMMVTAMGTAIRAERIREAGSSHLDGELNAYVSATALSDRTRRDWVLDRATAGKLKFSESEWRVLIDQKIAEASPYILSHFAETRRQPGAHTESDRAATERNVREFFQVLPPEEVSRHLYDSLGTVPGAAALAIELIQEIQAVDFVRVQELLSATDRDVAVRALQTLRGHPSMYSAEDVAAMEALAQEISSAFPKAEFVERSRRLSSKSKTVWICRCGSETDQEFERCTKCHRDRYGFLKEELNSLQAISLLTNRVEVLQSMLQQAAPLADLSAT